MGLILLVTIPVCLLLGALPAAFMTRRQAGRWARQDQQQYAEQAPPEEEPPSGSDMDNTLAQLKQLGELKSQGVLTEAEFEEQKSRILNA